MESKQKALIGLLKFASSSPKEAIKYAKEALSESKDYEFRQFLRAVGYFAVDREEYFVREYSRLSQNGIDELILNTIKDYVKQLENDFNSYKNVKPITFRKPNEPRMRIAYDVLAGWVLKFLYQNYAIIPIDYNNGVGWLYTSDNMPEGLELWKQFLDWLPREYIANNIETLLNIAVEKRIGQIVVPSIYFDVIASPLVELINRNPRYTNKFQASVKKKLNNAKTLAEKKSALCKSEKISNINSPFQFSNYELKISPSSRGLNKCIVCEDSNAIQKMGTKLLLPESKQRDYNSIADTQPALCSECFLAGFLSGLYPSSGTGYAICEVPLSNLYETFFFAEQMSGLTASLSVMQITNSSLLTILPSKYFIVRLSTGKGRLPKKTQLYLILKDYEKILFNFGYITVHVPEAGPISSIRIEVPLLKLLAIFSSGILPSHYTTDGNQKARANDAIQLLERGKPYTALYRLVYHIMQDKKQNLVKPNETNVFKSPLSYINFDEAIIKDEKVKTFLTKKLIEGGGRMLKEEPKEFYEDVKALSDEIYELVKPIAEDEVQESKSNVSVIVRKYTDVVKYRFPKLNVGNLQYIVAQRADKAEKRRLGGEQVFVEGKDKVQVKLESVEEKVLELYEKYYQKGNMYMWREFIKEVEARLLSKLLLNIRGARGA